MSGDDVNDRLNGDCPMNDDGDDVNLNDDVTSCDVGGGGKSCDGNCAHLNRGNDARCIYRDWN